MRCLCVLVQIFSMELPLCTQWYKISREDICKLKVKAMHKAAFRFFDKIFLDLIGNYVIVLYICKLYKQLLVQITILSFIIKIFIHYIQINKKYLSAI